MSVDYEEEKTVTKSAGRRWLVFGALAVAAAAALVLLASPGGSPDVETAGPPAPDVALPVAGGSEFTLAGHRGQVVVLDFLAPGCPSCAAEIPSLRKVTEAFGDRVVVVVVDVSGATAEYLEPLTDYYQEELGGGDRLVVGVDQELKTALDYEVQSLGTTVVVDQEGRILFRDQETTPFETLNRVVREALG